MVSHVLGSMRWLVSHVLGVVHWKWEIVTTEQVQLGIGGKGSNVGWYKVLRFFLLVIACCDNSGFWGVVTLKSLGGVFALKVFPIHKQITVSTLFSVAY